MFSLLKSEKDSDARTEYLIESKRMGISLKLPHINESDSDFKIEGKGIRFGLAAIKWLSEGVAGKIIAGRPFESKEQFKSFAVKKGSGINSRAVEALDLIGALTFEDNPRDEVKVRDNLYEYLNLPELNTSVPQHYYAYIDLVEDFDEQGVFVLLGIAKNIKRGKGWSRVEIMDSTGVIGIFDEEETKIEPGRTYLILAGANRISEAIPIDELKDHKENPLIKFLNYKQIPFANDEHFVLSFTPRVTKAGKRMANMIVADSSREMTAAMVFPTMFSTGYMKCQPGKVAKINFGETKEGTITLKEVL
jgi:DNA polymerase III alpha subunit